MHKFTLKYDFIPGEHTGIRNNTVTMETESEVLPDILRDFENFLKGCGYCLDGRKLELLEEDE